MKLVFFLAAFLFTQSIFCQNETSKWYFGKYAGLDFMTSPPTILTNGAINSIEGCATLADRFGNLIMYTDGTAIWNSSHTVIPNGSGLSGNLSTTQSAIIIKQPGNSNIFFVFTLGSAGNAPLNFSTVDMSQAAGAGSVTIKNTLLNSNCTEKLAAVNHCNGKDIWVLAHRANSADYLAYLVTAGGVNTTAIVSTIGSGGNSSYGGYLKISPNGKKVVSAMFGSCELYDFDNSTGLISNTVSLTVPPSPYGFYGCEFSPDGTKLYGSQTDGTIFQWDLCAGSPTSIVASLYTITNGSLQREALQLAKDGKIYVAILNAQALGVINNPNVLGSGCNYVDLAQSVSTQTCQWGFPNFNSSYFKFPPPTFTATINPTLSCESFFNSAQVPTICASAGSSVTGISWFFGDPASGTANTSTLSSPVHAFSGPGTYTVKQVFETGCAVDTLKQVLTIHGPTLSISAMPGFTFCSGVTATLTASGANTYSWNNGSTTMPIIISPTVSTSYTVTGGVGSCIEKEVISITVSKCLGVEHYFANSSLTIFPNPNRGEFILQTNDDIHLEVFNQRGEKISDHQLKKGTHNLEIKENPGIYFIRATNNTGTYTYKLLKSD